MDILVENRYLQHISIDWDAYRMVLNDDDDQDDFMESIAAGLAENSTLKGLGCHFNTSSRGVDYGPVLRSLVNSISTIKSLCLSVWNLDAETWNSMDRVLTSRACGLTSINLWGNLEDADFLRFLTIVENSRSLKSVTVSANDLRHTTLRKLISFLASTSLQEIEINYDDEYICEDNRGNRNWSVEYTQIKTDLIKAARTNMDFHKMSFRYDSGRSKKIENKMTEYGFRNAILRAAREISNGGLSLTALPCIVAAIDRLAKRSDEDYTWLRYTAVFKGLRTLLPKHDGCCELERAFGGLAIQL